MNSILCMKTAFDWLTPIVYLYCNLVDESNMKAAKMYSNSKIKKFFLIASLIDQPKWKAILSIWIHVLCS